MSKLKSKCHSKGEWISVSSDKREGLLCLDRKIDIYMNIFQKEIDLLFILNTKIYYWINHLSSSNYPVICPM